MQQTISLRLLPSEASDEQAIKKYITGTTGKASKSITGYTILKSSIDARGKQPWVNLTINAFIDEPYQERTLISFDFKNVSAAKRSVVVIGAGPAGLFAALKLTEAGIKPIIIERGKDVRARRRDLAAMNKQGEVNPESNYCFGEGGAGTYSDGKLYTRSSKRGDINRILQLFVHFGAEEKILYESHPHIGTNKLPHIITAMRNHLISCGAEVVFEQKVTDFIIEKDCITAVKTAAGQTFRADAFILATGHSARDIFQLFAEKNLEIESKPFALGVRVEHPQSLVDSCQYHSGGLRDPYLPPASYSLVQQVNDKGVFSFCMCPGGIIAPAATSPGELVVNGWSPSKRNNPYANSGIVVTVEKKDAWEHFKKTKAADDPLLLMHFQQAVEQRAFNAGGGKLVAPAQRLVDFCSDKLSPTLPGCSYLPGVHSSHLKTVLPYFIHTSLQQAFIAFGKKMKGYYSNDAIVVATESRTSSPVRIPRHPDNLLHPQLKNLYPCGEGAGYAGGIVSAAMDGERVVTQVAAVLQSS